MFRKLALFFFFYLAVHADLFSQDNQKIPVEPQGNLYDTDLLSKDFHTSRRDSMRAMMPDNSAAILFASPIRNRSNDVDYQYHQDPNFYYYTGYNQSGAMMLVFKESQTINGTTANEFIFVNERDPGKEVWNGKMPSKEEVTATSGIKSVLINKDFEITDFDFSKLSKLLLKVPVDVNENAREKGSTGWLVSKFKERTKDYSDKIDKVKMAQINSALREVKTPEEIVLLDKAVSITCKGFKETLKAAEPGMTEYQLKAINEYHWNMEGSEYAGYPSIVGGGENSCVLHYETDRKKLVPGDMVVMDMGAEYHGYTADVTRTFPVDGKFSTEERAIYQLVYDAQKAGIEACLAGTNFNEPHKIATRIIAEGLRNLGIIKTDDDVKKYFMHGTSHYLGLDVHDPGTFGPLKPNSVITVEPGIYIREGSDCDKKWWNIGVRIEDDVLITANGYRVMSDCIPKTIDEIEKLMTQKSIFNQIK